MMAGGGSIAAMNSTLRNNRKLSARRKARVKKVRDYFREQKVKKKEFNGKEVSSSKLKEINQKIRKEAALRRKKYYIATASTIAFFSLLFIILMVMR